LCLIIPEGLGDKVIERDTKYSHVLVFDDIDEETGRPTRSLVTGATGTQSRIFLDSDYELPTSYTNYFRLVRHFNPSLKKVLMLGGGGYAFVNIFLHENPEAELDVVEIDSELTDIAYEYFGLKEDSRLKIYHEGARRFINTTEDKYDAIIVDVFFSPAIPYQLTTIETVERLHGLLNDNGMVILNLISTVEGDEGRFLRAEYYTYKELFPQVHLIATRNPEDGLEFQNFVMIALKNDEKPSFESAEQDFSNYLANLWQHNIENDVPILTDDFAPVEQYVMRNLRKRY
jgi:spermidine synthase